MQMKIQDILHSYCYVHLFRNPIDCSPTRLLCLWDFLGKNSGVGCYFSLQEIFQTQGSNPSLLH